MLNGFAIGGVVITLIGFILVIIASAIFFTVRWPKPWYIWILLIIGIAAVITGGFMITAAYTS